MYDSVGLLDEIYEVQPGMSLSDHLKNGRNEGYSASIWTKSALGITHALC